MKERSTRTEEEMATEPESTSTERKMTGYHLTGVKNTQIRVIERRKNTEVTIMRGQAKRENMKKKGTNFQALLSVCVTKRLVQRCQFKKKPQFGLFYSKNSLSCQVILMPLLALKRQFFVTLRAATATAQHTLFIKYWQVQVPCLLLKLML